MTGAQDGDEIAPAAEKGIAIDGAVTGMTSMTAGVDGVKTQMKGGDSRMMSTSSMTGQLRVVFHALLTTVQNTSMFMFADAYAVTCRGHRRRDGASANGRRMPISEVAALLSVQDAVAERQTFSRP